MRIGGLLRLLVVLGLLVTGGCSTTVTPSPRPSSSASARGGQPSPSNTLPVNPFAARVPHFPPAPAPQRIKLPTGSAAPIYSRLPVTQPVAFLTMDDGQVRLPQDIQLMQAAHIPFTMFLIAPVAASDPQFFKGMEAAGGVVEDHTINHLDMRGRSYASQRHEICDSAPTLERTFGQRPQFFRPPGGSYDTTTLRVVHDCGFKAAFNWSETANYGKVYYQTSVHRIQPGDIILMHFRQNFVDDVLAALKAIHDAGLVPALLSDYVS